MSKSLKKGPAIHGKSLKVKFLKLSDVVHPLSVLSKVQSIRHLVGVCWSSRWTVSKMSTSASFNEEFQTETWTLYSVGMFLVLTRL
jgi:hypothetical protein